MVGSRYTWHRLICQLIGRLSARAIVLNLKVTEGVTARIILEFTQRFRFHIAEVHPGHHSPATIRIRADSQLVSGAFVGRGIRVPFSRIEAGVLVRWARGRINVAAAKVISDIAATVVIVGIVDDRIDFSIQIATGINNIEARNTSLNGQCGQIKFIHIAFWLKLG